MNSGARVPDRELTLKGWHRLAVLLLGWQLQAGAAALDSCIQERLKTADPTLTVGEIKAECEVLHNQDYRREPMAIGRLVMERRTEWNPFVITPHKQNYILPFTYMHHPNNDPYEDLGDESLKHQEAKMQVSFKVPLTEHNLLVDGDSLHFGFTALSFWQVYNRELSAPFRETNYQPEVFYSLPLPLQRTDHAAMLRLGFEHQSNGQTQVLSRSWNRIYAQLYYARNNYLIAFRPWYRIPENPKDDPDDASGDDNPDIDDYMGYFELTGVVQHADVEFSALLRNNLRGDNRGAIELGVSFPLFNRLRGYLQYFNGYGESLIDYDHRSQRVGLGILITDLM